MTPDTSVVMPTAQVDDRLISAARSVLDQKGVGVELIVVFDGVTPGHLDFLDDCRVRTVALHERQGIPRARNAGVRAASASLVAHLDADDLAAPGRLALQVAAMRTRPGLVCLGTGANLLSDDGRVLATLPAAATDPRAGLLLRNTLVTSSVMFRRDDFDAVGGYDENCPVMEDYDLWLRLASRGEVDILPEILTGYRLHDGQTSTGIRPVGPARRAVLRSRRSLARDLGSPLPIQRARDVAWEAAQWMRVLGIRRSRLHRAARSSL